MATMMFTTSVFTTLIAGASALSRANIPIAGFGQKGYSQQKWTAENDPVMGGVSVGTFPCYTSVARWGGSSKDLRTEGFVLCE